MAATGQVAGGLTAYDRQVLTAVNAGAASLSFVGSGFIVLCYVLFKELRKFSFKLVFYLALSDMLCSFFSMVGDPSRGFFCYSHGYSTHFFCVASFLWTTTIAFTLHRTVVKHKTDVEDLEAMFHLYVWGTSLVVTVVRSIGNNHSHIGTWCWAQTGFTGKALHFITFYMLLWGAILYNGFTYFQVIRMLNNARRMAGSISDRPYQSDGRAETKALNRWGYYPLILIGSWAFGTINRIHDFIEPDHKIFWLSVLDVGTSGLMGLFNSIAYGLNSSVRRAIQERLDLFWPDRLRRWFPNSSRLRNQHEESAWILNRNRNILLSAPEQQIPNRQPHHDRHENAAVERHHRQHQHVPDCGVHGEVHGPGQINRRELPSGAELAPQERSLDRIRRLRGRRGQPETHAQVLEVLVERQDDEAGEEREGVAEPRGGAPRVEQEGRKEAEVMCIILASPEREGRKQRSKLR
ncbi:hypothetical protein ACLB2K_017438 [Fragaria x ananassa]